MKSLISLGSLGRSDLEHLIARSSELRSSIDRGDPVPMTLSGHCVANIFFEPSTRTRLSFDLAAQRLGAHVITFHPETSSTTKGESLRDTVLTISAIGADILVARHSRSGVPQSIEEWTGLPVINAGDGVNEHPTQALLDAVTLIRHFGRIEGLRVAIVGDVARSRVAGSLVRSLPTLGADVTVVGPEHWLPEDPPVPATTDLDALLEDLDVVYLLRVQTERGGVVDEGYVTDFALDRDRVARMSEGAVIMHAGPMNRGVEIADDAAESPRSLVNEQVRNGVPTRMAVLLALAGEPA